jgi:glycine cleavage system H protein
MYPSDLKYTSTHEWARQEGEGTVSVGITEFAVSELGDVVFIELPEEGKEVKKGSPFGAIESVKAVFDLNSPVSGRVVGVNSGLSDDAEVLKTDPYKEGWLIKVKIDDPAELEDLMDSGKYSSQLEK